MLYLCKKGCSTLFGVPFLIGHWYSEENVKTVNGDKSFYNYFIEISDAFDVCKYCKNSRKFKRKKSKFDGFDF